MKVKTWPKQQRRELEKAFIRRNYALLALTVGASAGIWLFIWFLLDGHQRSFALGAWTVGTVWLLWAVVVLMSGSINYRFGGWGEDSTRDEFKKLRRNGWSYVQGLNNQSSDIDGVAVGPAGVFVVETKWTNETKDWQVPDRRESYARQALKNSNIIWFRLELHEPELTVKPLVAVWGPGTRALLEPGEDHDGVTIVHGLDMRAWLKKQPEVLGKESIRRVARVLAELAARGEKL